MCVCVRACRWRKKKETKTTTGKVKAHAVGGLKFEWGISCGVERRGGKVPPGAGLR